MDFDKKYEILSTINSGRFGSTVSLDTINEMYGTNVISQLAQEGLITEVDGTLKLTDKGVKEMTPLDTSEASKFNNSSDQMLLS